MDGLYSLFNRAWIHPISSPPGIFPVEAEPYYPICTVSLSLIVAFEGNAKTRPIETGMEVSKI